jgi:hypothetical protein
VLIEGQTIWDLSRVTDRPRTRLEFPDLIRFQDHWYCGFREGLIHNNHPSGRGRIIRSADGAHWDTVALFTWDSGDVREPKFAITAEGLLMINTAVYFVSQEASDEARTVSGESTYTPPDARAPIDRPGRFEQLDERAAQLRLTSTDLEMGVNRQSVTWLSRDGVAWSGAYACTSGVNTWLWAATWHRGMGYCMAQHGPHAPGTLMRTRDGKSWRALSTLVFPEGHGGETSLAFDASHDLVALLRGNNRTKLFVGRSQAPYYQRWTWTIPQVDWNGDGKLTPASELFGVGVGGPKLIRLSDGRFVASGRVLGPGCDDGRVTLFWLDPATSILTRFAQCDGTSYPGLFEHQGQLWITFVSSTCHQDNWRVQLARLPIPTR